MVSHLAVVSGAKSRLSCSAALARALAVAPGRSVLLRNAQADIQAWLPLLPDLVVPSTQ